MNDRYEGPIFDDPADALMQESPAPQTQPSAAEEAPRPDSSGFAARRREFLGLHLDQLAEMCRAGNDLADAFDGIDLDEWELDQLSRALTGAAEPWQALIAEGVAWRTKLETDLGRANGGQPLQHAELEERHDLMITDTALALALLDETQRAVNQMVLSGEIDDAKKLTGFRNKVGQGLVELKGRVGDEGYAAAETLSAELIQPVKDAAWTRNEAPAPSRRNAPASARARITYNTEAPASHAKPLLFVLGAAICLWAVLILPGLHSSGLPVLGLHDLTDRIEVRRVVAHPPSLFIEVDVESWNALDRDAQLALVDEIGRTAGAAGYFGAQFKAGDGYTVAQWLKERGSELVGL